MKKKEKILTKYRHIAVAGAGSGFGTSFISMGLAFYYAKMGLEVSYTECGNPGDKRNLIWNMAKSWQGFKNRKMVDFYDYLGTSKPIGGKHNFLSVHEGKVDLRLISDRNREESLMPSKEELLRLLASARGDVCIYDVDAEDQFICGLMDVDVLLIVVDPSPSKLEGNMERIRNLESISKSLREQGNEVIWIVNRDNQGVSRRRLKSLLKEREIRFFPLIPEELIVGSEYAGEPPWLQSQIGETFCDFFDAI